MATKSANLASLRKLIDLYTNMSDGDWKNSNHAKSYSSKEEYLNMLAGKVTGLSEATTTGAVAPVSTPFAFSKRGPGNVEAATQLGFTLSPDGGDSDKNKLKESVSGILYSKIASILQEKPESTKLVREFATSPTQPRQQGNPTQPGVTTQAASRVPGGGDTQALKTVDVQGDFSAFDQKLKSSTEQFKTEFQNSVQKKLLGKQVVARAAKGYKQPESDYTINITGVELDYYYDRYVIILVGRQENKQKTQRFFIKPGFKIKVLGDIQDQSSTEAGKIEKSKSLADTSPEEPENPADDVTSGDAVEAPEPEQEPAPEPPAPEQSAPEPEPAPDPGDEPQQAPVQPDPRKLRQRGRR